MATAVNTLVAQVRQLIPEASAIEWTDAQIIVFLDLEHKAWAAELGKLPGPGWFTIDTTFTLTANATTYDLSALVTASVGEFAAIKSLWYLPTTGRQVHIERAAPGTEDEFRLAIGEAAVGQSAPKRFWLTRSGGTPTLNLHPQSDQNRDFRLYVRYEPKTLAAGATVQTDPRHDQVLVRGAVLRALETVGETDPVVEGRYERDKARYLEDERNVAGEHDSETTKVVLSEYLFG